MTTMVKPSIKDLVFVNRSSAINKVDSSISKVGGAKSKNIVISDSLAKSKLLVKPSFGYDVLTSKARLAFTKLKQAFIET